MGIIQKFREFNENRQKRAVQKNQKAVANPKAIAEDRKAALDYFVYFKGDPKEAVIALLQRFHFSLEHGINDSREKETAMKGILAFKEAAVEPVLEFLRSSTKIAWPIKILKVLLSERELIQALFSALDFSDVDFDQGKVDKNYDLLCYLRDYKLSKDQILKLFHFLQAPDERVRFGAVEALVTQDDHEEVFDRLESYAYDESAENSRLKQAVLELFDIKKRPLKNRPAVH